MPFDLSSAEKIDVWRRQADDFRQLAKHAHSDHERDAFLTIALSYESLVRSEVQIILQRRRGILHHLNS